MPSGILISLEIDPKCEPDGLAKGYEVLDPVMMKRRRIGGGRWEDLKPFLWGNRAEAVSL